MRTDGEDLAELRRRVYAPDATDEDRRRYADAMAAEPPSPAAPLPEADERPGDAPTAPRRPRRRIALIAAIAAAVAVAVVVTAVLLRPAPPAGPPPEQLPVTADERSTFINALVIGTDAGIAAYLVVHREPPELSDAIPTDAVEERGVGPADIVLLKDGGSTGDVVVPGRTTETAVAAEGRVTVLLVVAQSADVGWTLEDGTGARPRVITQRGGFQAAGSLTSAVIRYGVGGRPDRLKVDVPAGVPWGAAAIYSN